MVQPGWEWGGLGPMAPERTLDEISNECAKWLEQFLRTNKLDLVTSPDGIYYDLEIQLVLVPTAETPPK